MKVENPSMFRQLTLCQGATCLTRSRRTSLYREGTPADSVYLVESGMVSLQRTTTGGKTVLLDFCPQGSVFGLSSLVGEFAYTTEAVCLQPVNVWRMTKEEVLSFCHQHPIMWTLIVKLLADQQDRMQRRIEHLASSDLRARIEYYLDQLACCEGNDSDSRDLTISLSQLEIAQIVGGTRESVSTILNTLQREERLELAHRRIVLRRRAQVAAA